MSAGAWIWNIFVLTGCGYVVFGLGHSGWWFALALVLLFSPYDDCECDSESEGEVRRE